MRQGPWRPSAAAGLFLALLLVSYLWCATAGTWRHWHTFSNDESVQATAFLHGKLSLPIQPPAALLALSDPYDKNARRAAKVHEAAPFIHDLAFYKRKFYLPWGPVPALVTAAVAFVVGQREPDWGDQYLVFAFTLGTMILAIWLLREVRRRFFPQFSPWADLPPLLSLGLSAPVFWIVSRGAVYEAGISGGQFFLLAGFCCAWMALARPRPHAGWLALAASCWALSMGSRISFPPAVMGIAIVTAFYLWRRRAALGVYVALFLPVVMGGGLMGYFNFARFHSFTEFGVRYQLSGTGQSKPLASGYFSGANVLPNVVVYLIAPPKWGGESPFLHAVKAERWLPKSLWPASDYKNEEVVGLLWTQPFVFVAIAALLWRWPKAAAVEISEAGETAEADRALRKWLIASVAVFGALAAGPVLVSEFSTMRYLFDVTPCLTILAAIAYCRVMNGMSAKEGRIAGVVIYAVVIAQILLAGLLVIDLRAGASAAEGAIPIQGL
ncbi:MAG: hypothetical protein ABSH22_14055 [Tepidisphaeraceae bacterium]